MENPIEILKQEHEEIERELIELETVINSEEVNYPNLVHIFKNLISIWDRHELKEELFFPVLEKQGVRIPIENMKFDHKALRLHKEALKTAINSGKDSEIHKALEINAKIILEKLRQHIQFEDDVLYTLTTQQYGLEELKENWEKIINQF